MAQLDMIFGRLRRIEHMQQRSSNFDSADKSLMEENLERITTGSLFQVILMIAVATVQVGLIRSLFDQQSYFYKIWLGNRSHNIHARC
nr:SJCHGC09714 protein [Schistosoma japonicum]